MAFQQPVELGAVAPGQARRLGDVAPGDLEDAHQVVALEGPARLIQRRERRVGRIERLAHPRLREHPGARPRPRPPPPHEPAPPGARPGPPPPAAAPPRARPPAASADSAPPAAPENDSPA